MCVCVSGLYSGGSPGVIVFTSVLLQDSHAIHVAARNYDFVVAAALSVICTHTPTHTHETESAQSWSRYQTREACSDLHRTFKKKTSVRLICAKPPPTHT